MLQIIQCSNCSKSGAFKIEFKFTREYKTCEKCHHTTHDDWSFYFCDLKCFKAWMKKNKGIPCQQCYETGWAFGCKPNGKCKVCHGKKMLP